MTDLSIEKLNVFKGERHLLKDVSLHTRQGQCMQILGPNGSGKTTLLRSVAGLAEVETLQLRFAGEPVSPRAPEFQQQFVYLGHDAPLKGDLTGAENLRFWMGLRSPVSGVEVHAALAKVGASSFVDRPARVLSAGQRRRIALAFLLLAKVPLWLLDEPTTHLDTGGRALVASLLEGHLRSGGLALVVTHQPLGLAEAQVLEYRLLEERPGGERPGGHG